MTEVSIVERVATYCTERWIPFSLYGKECLTRDIFSKPDGSIGQDVASELKFDLALYTLSLQYLCEDPPISNGRSIKGLNQLPNLFSEVPSIYKRFNRTKSRGTDTLTENEATTFVYAITLSAVTEALATVRGLDSEVGFMFGLLRQLGTMLIAFNYPTVLREALDATRKGMCTFHEGLATMLGVSPNKLGHEVLSRWKVSNEIIVALTYPESQSGNDEIKILFDCSDRAEKLARTELEVGLPTFLADRQAALDDLERELGKQGMFDLTQNINERLYSYVKDRPELFSNCSLFSLTPGEQGVELYLDNGAVQDCPPMVKSYFLSAYKLAEQGKASPLALTSLTTKVVPQIGFSRGCLYIVDKHKEALIPKLFFGESDKQLTIPLSYKFPEPQYLGLIQALTSRVPIIERKVLIAGRRLSHVSGRLQEFQERSILFLEIDKELTSLSAHEILLRFYAIRRALLDFLNLSG
jgi:hypothetical protein